MISIEEIRNIATLARLKLSPAEEEDLRNDISSILDYVGQVSAVGVSTERKTPLVRNVMRDDAITPTLGDPEALRAAFPKREGKYNVVRKIIEKDAGAQ